MTKVTFYMKSGNSFTLTMKSCKWKTENNCVVEIDWVSTGDKALNYIALDQIEAIVSGEFDQ